MSCAKEFEALSGMHGHAVHLCHKVEALRPVTCADGHGWQRQAGLYASDQLAVTAAALAIGLEAPQDRACRCLRSRWHRTGQSPGR